MSHKLPKNLAVSMFVVLLLALATQPVELTGQGQVVRLNDSDRANDASAAAMRDEGRRIFRFDDFADLHFWGGALKLHQAIAGSRFGGVGNGLTPRAALALGLKVDSEAIPAALAAAFRAGQVNLDDPANTIGLIWLDSVLGVKGYFDTRGQMVSIGLTCAVCHSTVDDSFSPGIGRRLDGWANRDLNVGAIVALAPDLSAITRLLGVDEATVRTVLNSWGPGKFDAELILDGKAFRPDGKSAATLIPPAFGLAGVNLNTWTGWGSVTHWNAFVANLELHGIGNFYDPRLNDPIQFPVAARNGLGNVRAPVDFDFVTSKLGPLHFYQLGIPAPPAPARASVEAVTRGRTVFNGKARCASCHVPPLFTEPGWNMHTPAEIGIDDFQANRSPDKRYRTAPLKGLWTHQKGGFFHDGRFPTLREVIDHYNTFFGLGLTEQEKTDLAEYLLSI
jgi:hypothetical protein